MKFVVAAAAGAAALVATSSPLFAQAKEFPDVPADHWAAQAVKMLEDQGIVIGYPDGTYGGPKAMTRYEFAEAISRLLPLIDRRIADAIAKIPPAPALPGDLVHTGDLNNYYTKGDIDQRLQGYVTTDALNAALAPYAKSADVYSKTEADARFAAKADLDMLRALLDRFRDQLTALGMDVDALKAKYAALDARVTELEKLRVFGTGTIAWKSSAQYYGGNRGQIFSGVDRDGALLDNGTFINPTGLSQVPPAGNASGKKGFFNNPSTLFDTQIGIQYSPSRNLQAVAQFILGNYYGAWNEQQAYSAAFGGGAGAASGSNTALLSNRQQGSLALQAYQAYVAAPLDLPIFPNAITGSGAKVGRIPTKLTKYTWWAVDPDTYVNIAREDSGEINITGGAITGRISNWSLTLAGGYNPTDGTDPWLVNNFLDNSRAGTVGFGHYVRPGGSQTAGLTYPNLNRTHLDRNYYSIPSLTTVGMARLSLPYIGLNYVVGTGDDWRNAGLTGASPAGAGAPSFNRFGQVYSIDWNTTLPVNRLSTFFPTVGFQGEVAESKTNQWGTYSVIRSALSSTEGKAVDYKLTFPIGSTSWYLGGKSVGANFNAPGYWGQLGSWVNPWNVVSDSPIYVKGGTGPSAYQIPVIPTELGVGVPLNNVPLIGDVAFNLQAGVGHLQNSVVPTVVSPNGPIEAVNNPRYLRMTHAAMGFSFGAGPKSGYKIGVSSEDVLRDYPSGGSAGRDVTFLWGALKGLFNVQGGNGIKQPSFNGTTAGQPVLQSDENYYQFSVGKNLTADGSALAKLLFQRVVYTDRTGNGGGSYRGAVGALQLTYKF